MATVLSVDSPGNSVNGKEVVGCQNNKQTILYNYQEEKNPFSIIL